MVYIEEVEIEGHLVEKVFEEDIPEESELGRIETRVKRGIKLLDSKIPDWRMRVDPTGLDLQSPCNCVLGQLGGMDSGAYNKSLEKLGISSPQDEWYGFESEGAWSGSDDEYEALTEEWRRHL